ncbi:hypothetical protein [Gynuella sp.]|uniref:hypothetical protein n=1 Tax=Gynuella sp. TaxID=2969146 RepID=UPI003D129175
MKPIVNLEYEDNFTGFRKNEMDWLSQFSGELNVAPLSEPANIGIAEKSMREY